MENYKHEDEFNMIDWFKKVVFENYVNFSERARRSEYWWFYLANIILSIIATGIDLSLFKGNQVLSSVVSLGLFLPALAVTVRRLHDIGKSGWNVLFAFLPIIGWILLIIWLVKEGDQGDNEYGADPKGSSIENFETL